MARDFCMRLGCLMNFKGTCRGLNNTKAGRLCSFYKDRKKMTPEEIAAYETGMEFGFIKEQKTLSAAKIGGNNHARI